MGIPKKIRKYPRLVRSLMGLLILFYLIGSLQLDSLHQILHQHEESASHSEEAEQNACHRTIFHLATENACDHPTHLTELKKCPWCQGTLHQDSGLAIATPVIHFSSIVPLDFDFNSPFKSISLSFASNRGPPTEMI